MSSVAGRLARRLVHRAPWQSTLIVIVLALPVAIGAAVAAVSATARPTPEERLALFWGSANARLETISPGAGQPVRVEDPLVLDARVGSVLPPGTKRALDLDVTLPLTSAQGRRINTSGRVLNLADPITRGIYRLDEGALSNAPRALTLSSALAAKLNVDVGDEVLVGGQPMQLVALISDRQDLMREIAVVPPAAIQLGGPLHFMLSGDNVGTPRWLLQLPDPLDPPPSQLLADYGLAVVDRDTALRRVAESPLVEFAALGLGTGLLLEAALMATAAF